MLEVCSLLPRSVVGTVVTALVSGVVLVLLKLLSDKLHRYLPMPIPGELLTVWNLRRVGRGEDTSRPVGTPGFNDQLEWAPGRVPEDGV